MIFPLNRLIESRFEIFLLVGLANTLISYAVFGFCYKVTDLNYTLSLTVAYLLGIMVSYASHRKITFNSKIGHKRLFPRFLLLYLFLFFFNAGLLTVLTERGAIDPLVGQAICILVLPVIGFFFQRVFIFKE